MIPYPFTAVGAATGAVWVVGFAAMIKLTSTLTQMQGHWVLGFAGALIAVLFAKGGCVQNLGATGRVGKRIGPASALIFAAGNWIEAGLGLEFGVQLFAIGILGIIASAFLFAVDAKRVRSLPRWSVYPLAVCHAALLPALNAGARLLDGEGATPSDHFWWKFVAGTSVVLAGASWTLFSMGLETADKSQRRLETRFG